MPTVEVSDLSIPAKRNAAQARTVKNTAKATTVEAPSTKAGARRSIGRHDRDHRSGA